MRHGGALYLTVLSSLAMLGCSGDGPVEPGSIPGSYPWLTPGYDATFVQELEDGTEGPHRLRWEVIDSLPDSEYLRTTDSLPDSLYLRTTRTRPLGGPGDAVVIEEETWLLLHEDGAWMRPRLCFNQGLAWEEFLPAELVRGYQFHRYDCTGEISEESTIVLINATISIGQRDYRGFVVRTFVAPMQTDVFYDFAEGPVMFEEHVLVRTGDTWEVNPNAMTIRLEVLP